MNAGVILIGTFFLLLVLNVPIAWSIGMSVVLYMVTSSSFSLNYLAQTMFTGCDSFTLMAIPLFILAGALMGRRPEPPADRLCRLHGGPQTGRSRHCHHPGLYVLRRHLRFSCGHRGHHRRHHGPLHDPAQIGLQKVQHAVNCMVYLCHIVSTSPSQSPPGESPGGSQCFLSSNRRRSPPQAGHL